LQGAISVGFFVLSRRQVNAVDRHDEHALNSETG
jgi:hypothetical protein